MLRIAGGRVYDPANGIAGEVRDVCVEDGKIVADVAADARRIDARATTTADAARVAFATAADGIEVAGTVHRMDGVPLPLRAPLAAERPSVEAVLAAIADRL